MSRGSNFVRFGSDRLYVPRGWGEREMWASRGMFVPRRYFAMLVNPYSHGVAVPTDPDAPGDELYYVDTDVAAGGDGSIGDPWATMEEARAGIIALHSSFVTDTVRVDLICFGATDDATAVTNTWPTSSTSFYLTIKTPDVDRKAQWDASVYTMARSIAGASGPVLGIGTNSIRLKGIQIFQLLNGGGSNFPRPLDITSLGGEFVADGIKLRGSGSTNNSVAFKTSGTTGRFVFRNCMTTNTLHGFLIGNPTGLVAGSEVDIYNCTTIGATTAGGEAVQLTWAAGGAGKIARVKNLISRQRANGITTTNENTEDLATNSHVNAAPSTTDFVDPVGADYRLKAGGSLMDAGTDLSAVADFPFNRDATLYTRPFNGTWDQGFHEFR